MKKRFRKLVREGWHVVKLNRQNLWNYKQDSSIYDDWGDEHHYRHIRSWCNNAFPKSEWEGRLLQNNQWSDSNGSVITKEFAFKNEKDKTMFILKWS
jgi:hypothetical protein